MAWNGGGFQRGHIEPLIRGSKRLCQRQITAPIPECLEIRERMLRPTSPVPVWPVRGERRFKDAAAFRIGVQLHDRGVSSGHACGHVVRRAGVARRDFLPFTPTGNATPTGAP